jgi:TonB family protein
LPNFAHRKGLEFGVFMGTTQAVAMIESWQQWEGRIVNGEFPLLQYLGGSEQSAVYLTEIQGARAATKLVPANSPHAEAQLASWKLAGNLSHPNLIRILHTGLWHADDQQDMHFAVMEYCEESLAGVLRQRPLTADETREMLAPVLDVLQYLHAQDIAHGQINPANIMAAGDQLKLSSDGVRRMDDVNPERAIGPYAAPEQRQGRNSRRGDIWSLGMTLVEVLTDRLPACDEDGTPELPELPAPFDAIANGCLVVDPERRLPVSEIRSLLLRPQGSTKAKAIAVAEPKPVAQADARPLPEPKAAPYVAVLPAPRPPQLETTQPAPGGGRRPLALIAAAVFLVLAIVAGVRLMRDRAASSPATTVEVAQPAAPTAAAPAKSPEISAPKPPVAKASSGAVLHQVMPEIPAKARSTVNGTVKINVRVDVDPQGKVSRAKVASGGSSKYLANLAVQAAQRWTFTAPVRDGKAQSSEWSILFEIRRSGTKASAHRT